MGAIPGDLETDRQPPMTVPLRHFLVGLGFLLAGSVLGIAAGLADIGHGAGVAHVHLLLAGWVCITIMGAMTQFVPVWSGVPLYSRRLAVAALWSVSVGLMGFAGGLVLERYTWLWVWGTAMLLGFWGFVYNVGRTLGRVDGFDVTERHFAMALGFFVLVTGLGMLLAVDLSYPVLARVHIERYRVVRTHATLAVFGIVLTTIIGALYQLATMFTQTELHGLDLPLKGAEEVAYPSGVVLLAVGRLGGSVLIGQVGGTLLVLGLTAFTVVLARRLYETAVPWTPMLSRYAVVVPAMIAWEAFAVRAWLRAPLSRGNLFGAEGTEHLLLLGLIGIVVLGTLYHIVPFIIWVHRYSDRLGYEPVPMVDDLYHDRVATADFGLVVVGGMLLVVADLGYLVDPLYAVGGILVVCGVLLFTANILLVIREHSPHGVGEILFDSGRTRPGPADDGDDGGSKRVDAEP